MSWLTFPCETVPALNRINEALIERWNYMMPSQDTGFGTMFEFISAPCSSNVVKNRFELIRQSIAKLYAMHFPIENLGIWTKNWRPYDQLNETAIQDAIAGELSAVGIDPGGFYFTAPHLISDNRFIRACYHLINNVLRYSVYGLGGAQSCQSRLLKWGSNGAYDRNQPSVDEIVNYGESGLPGCAAYGTFKAYLRCEFDRRFHQNAFDVWGNQYSPELRGNWKGRYTTEIRKELTKPLYSDIQSQGYYYTASGVTEINFTGTESEILPWHSDITQDLEYYKTWGNYKYYYTMSRQVDRLSEVLLNAESFPIPNYKYLDQ